MLTDELMPRLREQARRYPELFRELVAWLERDAHSTFEIRQALGRDSLRYNITDYRQDG